jgi:D-alanine-D-alanine ligase
MRVAVVFDTPYSGWSHDQHWKRMEEELAGWETGEEPEQEYQVADALRQRGHEVRLVGVEDDPSHLIDELRENPVDLAFNVTESFHGIDRLDYLVPALLEAQEHIYTGAPPLALQLTRNKALTKKILAHHGILVPRFATYRPGEEVPDEPALTFPLIVKPLQLDASIGIAHASVVRDVEGMRERVTFVHERLGGAAIVEEFVEGRELYIGILGNDDKLEILPATELVFDKEKSPPEERIATRAAKWDESYRERRGIKSVLARRLSRSAQEQIQEAAVTAFRTLWLRDYARLDIRLDAEDRVWVLEANANPYLSWGHEFAKAAEKIGIEYPELVERIAKEALERAPVKG